MEDNKSLLVINAIVNKENVAELQAYLGKVMEVFAKNGGRPVGRYKTLASLHGEDSPEMMAILAFPNEEVIKELVNGAEFQALADLRARVFSRLNMMICTSM